MRKICDIYLDPRLQRFAVFSFESFLDVSEIDFRTGNNDADESLIVGS